MIRKLLITQDGLKQIGRIIDSGILNDLVQLFKGFLFSGAGTDRY